jgi:hypothetical protein
MYTNPDRWERGRPRRRKRVPPLIGIDVMGGEACGPPMGLRGACRARPWSWPSGCRHHGGIRSAMSKLRPYEKSGRAIRWWSADWHPRLGGQRSDRPTIAGGRQAHATAAEQRGPGFSPRSPSRNSRSDRHEIGVFPMGRVGLRPKNRVRLATVRIDSIACHHMKDPGFTASPPWHHEAKVRSKTLATYP